MNDIARTFAELKKRNEGALIAYVTAGDPEPASTSGIVETLIEGGVDIAELGVPFSDPIADGPTIQAASVRALKAGTTPKKVLETVEKIKNGNRIPLLLMTYYNPIFRMQTKKFFETAKASGVDGVIVPDLPIEEADEYKKYADDNEIDTVFLAAPSTSASRLKEILKYSSGFLYLVSVFGVTGARKRVEAATLGLIENTLSITRGRIPLSVGFGISEPEHVKTVLQNGADAAIVGSGFVKVVETERNKERKMLETLKEYASQLKEATKSTGKN